MELLVNNLRRAFELTADLLESLAEENLALRLGDLPSNTIGEQFWCIIGARESYTQAVIQGKWVGFSCSLADPRAKNEVLNSLKMSQAACLDYLEGRELSDIQLQFALALLEHEVQHHGQLIRYVYGNKLAFPDSWHKRYTV